jgi:hypothetical protein
MGDDMVICMASCNSSNSSGATVGNDSYDLECITQCSQRQAILYQHATEKYDEGSPANRLQKIIQFEFALRRALTGKRK